MNELTRAVVLLMGIALDITDPLNARVTAELRSLLVTLHERSEAARAYQDTPRGVAALERSEESLKTINPTPL